MKRLPLIAIAILAIATAFYGGYTYSQRKTADATKKSYDAGYAAGAEDNQIPKAAFSQMIEDNEKLRDDYNALIGKYNQLVSAPQQRQPITCNTYNYDMLNSSTTRCW